MGEKYQMTKLTLKDWEKNWYVSPFVEKEKIKVNIDELQDKMEEEEIPR
jgi:hypothetical protein